MNNNFLNKGLSVQVERPFFILTEYRWPQLEKN
jgi:hypothetical protein